MLPIHFAPLQGYTEAPYRAVHQQVCGGIDTYYTPFIRLEHGQIRKKDFREALPEENRGVHVVPQVIASSADEFQILCQKLAEVGHKRIDINMGCPFPLQTRLGRGSGIWQYPDRVEAILEMAGRLHDTLGIDFSLKMRLGQESPDEALALIDKINAIPLVHIALHPRVGKQQYKGELLMDAFEMFYEKSANPLIFNGELKSVDEMIAIEQRFPRLKGLMVGRGLLSRPTLAKEYQLACQQPTDGTARIVTMSDDEVRKSVLQMHRLLYDYYQQHIEGGDAQLLQKMHSFWDYMEPLFGHKVVKKILKSGSIRNYQEATSNAR